MRNRIKYVLLAAITFMVISSCNKDDYKYTYDGATIVQFIESSGTFFVLEDATASYKIKFQLIGNAKTDLIDIPYEFIDSAEINGNIVYSTIFPDDSMVTITEGSLKIPSGELFGELNLTGVYDKLNFGEVDTLLLKIKDGASTKVDPYNNIMLIKVQKYYPYLPEEFPGTYNGNYSGYALGGFGNWGVVETSPGLEIAIGEEPNTLVITSGFYQEQVDDWGESWTDGPYPIKIYMNTDDPTSFKVEIPEIQLIGTTNDEFTYYAAPYPEPGEFNAATKELVIRFYEIYGSADGSINDIGEYTVQLDEAAVKMIQENSMKNKN
jgi:hypothetical protein